MQPPARSMWPVGCSRLRRAARTVMVRSTAFKTMDHMFEDLPMRTYLLGACAVLLLTGAPQARAQAGDVVHCRSETFPGSRYEITCELTRPSPSRLRFSVRLSGGHDDSSSVLEVRHSGVQLACGPGSKVSSDGEYGDIELACIFDAPQADVAAPLRINVSLKASHVELERYSLTAP